jgi:hypothetical protein
VFEKEYCVYTVEKFPLAKRRETITGDCILSDDPTFSNCAVDGAYVGVSVGTGDGERDGIGDSCGDGDHDGEHDSDRTNNAVGSVYTNLTDLTTFSDIFFQDTSDNVFSNMSDSVFGPEKIDIPGIRGSKEVMGDFWHLLLHQFSQHGGFCPERFGKSFEEHRRRHPRSLATFELSQDSLKLQAEEK